MGRIVYGIGETICDIIFKDNKPQVAKPGGSTFNAMVSLGRLGVPSSFISKIGDDHVGEMIVDFMEENNVSTECLTIWKGHQTDIALAFLDAKGDANYSFYKNYDKQFVEAALPEFKKDDILLLGSYFALNPLLRPLVEAVISAAHKAKSIVYYDPNFRTSHLPEIESLRPKLLSNIKMATVVRGSDEDFKNILGHEQLEEIKDICSHLVVTRNSDGVDVFHNEESYHVEAQEISVLSTIGAGDNFNAGFIYALIKYNIGYDELQCLDQAQWYELVSMAVACSSDVCQSYDNYISKKFAADLLRDCSEII